MSLVKKWRKVFFVLSWVLEEHQSVESEGLRFDSSWGLRIFFFVPHLWLDKNTFSISLPSWKLTISHYFTKMVLLTSLILAVCRTHAIIIWTLWWALLITSVWLSYRVLEHRIRRSNVLFLMGTQNFFLSHTPDKMRNIFLFFLFLLCRSPKSTFYVRLWESLHVTCFLFISFFLLLFFF